MAAASALSLWGQWFRPLKQLAMNSRLPKRMVLLWEKPMRNRHSPSAVMVIADEGTIRTSIEKNATNPSS
jgi:hypothetical protein